MARLLDHRPTGAQQRRLAGHLVAHRPLDRAQRVDILGLGACPERDGRLVAIGADPGAQRDVRVAPKRPLLHLHVGDPKRPQQVPQRGDIGPRDLWRALPRSDHRLGDDLDERDAGPVVVDEGVVRPVDPSGRAADMGRLAGVLLHVGALDEHPEDRPVVQLDVQPAVARDRLVILAGLEVLGHVRVEVVLPREAAPRRDLAVERQPDPDRRLDPHLVDHRQRSRQPEAHRAHLGVGLGPKGRRAAAEHLRQGAQLDVDLKSENWVV